jgi:hypothetical protein
VAEGVRQITLCDADGELVRAGAELHAALKAAGRSDALVLQAEERADQRAHATDCPVVRVISMRTGRDDVVAGARVLCERVRTGSLAAADIDEDTLEAELRANASFPEPVSAAEGAASTRKRPSPRRYRPRACACRLAFELRYACVHVPVGRSLCCSAAPRSTWVGCCRGTAA